MIRFFILAAAVVMQMCLGATYSWSVYVQSLKDLTGLSQSGAQVPFTLFYFVFPLSMMVAGRFLPRLGSRKSAMTGGLLFGTGWVLAGFGDHSIILTIVGIGLVSGIGAGMAYVVPISVCVKWFPDNKGLVTGIAVAGFGGGAALVSQVGGMLIADNMRTPFEAFQILGIAFMICTFLAGFMMITPEGEEPKHHVGALYARDILSSSLFRLLYLVMVIGLAAGFAVNANLKELFPNTHAAAAVGVTAVSLFAVANAAGRISWGWLFDRVDSKRALQANLLIQAVTLLLFPVLVQYVSGFLLLSFLVGFNYGGVLVLYVSTVSVQWGVNQVGQVYGLLFTSNIPASLAPLFAAVIYDRFASFSPALAVLSFMLLAAVFVVEKMDLDPVNQGVFQKDRECDESV